MASIEKGNPKMSNTTNPTLKLGYFVLGIGVPLAAYLLWCRTSSFRFCARKSRVDKAHDVTVEDSFPASDPPSSNGSVTPPGHRPRPEPDDKEA